MTRRAFLPYLCVFLLLAAQQGAIVHAVWHSLDSHLALSDVNHAFHDSEGTHQRDTQSQSGQASLCPFDMAFSQVLGGTHAVCAPLAFVPAVVERIHELTAPLLYAEAISPKSRGPPILL